MLSSSLGILNLLIVGIKGDYELCRTPAVVPQLQYFRRKQTSHRSELRAICNI